MWVKEVIKQTLMNWAMARDRAMRARLGMSDRDLRAEQWGARESATGHLEIGGADVAALASTFGTPLHVVDAAKLRETYTSFLRAFRTHYPHVEIGYSYKTNPLPGVLKLLHACGASAEVISPFELWLALELGVPPERIIVNGPGKTEAMLELAVARKVSIINIDNRAELDLIQRFAERHDHVQSVGVRVVTSVGWSSQFGLGIRTGAARRAFEQMATLDRLEPCGLHVHLGTGIRDVSIYLKAVREVLDFARAMTREFGVRFRVLDLGGGFGVPTVKSYSQMDRWLMAKDDPPTALDVNEAPRIEVYGQAIANVVREHFPEGAADAPTLVFEPGRAVTSSAQTLILRVLAVKAGDGKIDSVILDGGVNLAMPTMWEYHEILAATKLNKSHDNRYRICGPLCHPGDVLAAAKRLPALEPGDLIAVMDAGAYFIPNQMNFSTPRAAAVIVEGGRPGLIRGRERFEDIVALDRVALASATGAAEAGRRHVASR